MSHSRSQPGLIISVLLHVMLLVAALFVSSHTSSFEDAPEGVPVEIISENQLQEWTKAEKQEEAQASAPVLPPAPPPVPKEPDPVPEKELPAPPPPPPSKPDLPKLDPIPEPPPLPTPPAPPEKPTREIEPHPDPKAELPPPLPEPKPQPPAPAPPKPEPPKIEPPAPEPPKAAPKSSPPPPPLAPRPPKESSKDKMDEIAKVLAANKAESKPTAPSAKPPKSLDTSEISRLLAEKSTNTKSSAALPAGITGGQNASPHMSPALLARFQELVKSQFRECWDRSRTGMRAEYQPKIIMRLKPDGYLDGPPQLQNPAADPVMKAMGEAALRAIKACEPLKIPAEFSPYYQEWKTGSFTFKPDDME